MCVKYQVVMWKSLWNNIGNTAVYTIFNITPFPMGGGHNPIPRPPTLLKMIPSRDITMINKPWKCHVDRRKTQWVIVLTDIITETDRDTDKETMRCVPIDYYRVKFSMICMYLSEEIKKIWAKAVGDRTTK